MMVQQIFSILLLPCEQSSGCIILPAAKLTCVVLYLASLPRASHLLLSNAPPSSPASGCPVCFFPDLLALNECLVVLKTAAPHNCLSALRRCTLPIRTVHSKWISDACQLFKKIIGTSAQNRDAVDHF
ncbi:hypothetical protein EPR50_G00198840 [Perca flavescens]|uniref:Uncharacterized protein n=1 Tax=Perca flavescens TaxID=8167 RepID=A0A484CCT8_PERFV|nr:hypothetical protein EPR50_G00198840 [Perca flavescens]